MQDCCDASQRKQFQALETHAGPGVDEPLFYASPAATQARPPFLAVQEARPKASGSYCASSDGGAELDLRAGCGGRGCNAGQRAGRCGCNACTRHCRTAQAHELVEGGAPNSTHDGCQRLAEQRWLAAHREAGHLTVGVCAASPDPVHNAAQNVCPAVSKRQVLGSSAGKPSLLNDNTKEFCVDVLRRRDRGNDGMNLREATDMAHDLAPALSRAQASRVFCRTIRPANTDVLSSIVKGITKTVTSSQMSL